MISYKDITFCEFNHLCKLRCERAITNNMKQTAEKYNLVISTFTNPPFDYDGDGDIKCDHLIEKEE